MSELHVTESIRELALALFDEVGADQTSPLSESLLVRKGYVVGRCFRRSGIRIVWFFDEAELKVYDADGKLLKAVMLAEQWQKVA